MNTFHESNTRIYWPCFQRVLHKQPSPALTVWREPRPAPSTALFVSSLAISLSLAVFAELQLRPTESRPAAERLQLQHAGERQRFVPSSLFRRQPPNSPGGGSLQVDNCNDFWWYWRR